MFALSIASIAGSLLAGALIDRWGPRRVLMTFEMLFVPAALAIAAAQTLPQLAAIVGIWAFVGSPVVTAGASFAPFLTTGGEQDLKRVNAWLEGAGSMSFAVGPGAGALLVRYANVDWVFLLDAATSLVAALLVWRVHLTMPSPKGAAIHSQSSLPACAPPIPPARCASTCLPVRSCGWRSERSARSSRCSSATWSVPTSRRWAG
jgi:MFS family permease